MASQAERANPAGGRSSMAAGPSRSGDRSEAKASCARSARDAKATLDEADGERSRPKDQARPPDLAGSPHPLRPPQHRRVADPDALCGSVGLGHVSVLAASGRATLDKAGRGCRTDSTRPIPVGVNVSDESLATVQAGLFVPDAYVRTFIRARHASRAHGAHFIVWP